jgi:hypothetical protein
MSYFVFDHNQGLNEAIEQLYILALQPEICPFKGSG